MPQIVNALLSRHNFILLGLRGQAKSRILRALVSAARSTRCRSSPAARSTTTRSRRSPSSRGNRIAEGGDDTPIAWVGRDSALRREARDARRDRSPTSSATSTRSRPRAAGTCSRDELTIHYGMLPRANRGIFALNELPDLAGKVQVGLFNIMQEGDVQIKGYPVRLPLDVLLCFTANPEDYTARGKIITPLKDRIGSEIVTHYPGERGARDGDHAAGGVDGAQRRGRPAAARPRPDARRRRSWSASRSRRARTSASTSARASRSACRSRSWRTSCPTPSGARCARATARSCRASRTCSRRCRRSPARSSSSTRASWWAVARSRAS